MHRARDGGISRHRAHADETGPWSYYLNPNDAHVKPEIVKDLRCPAHCHAGVRSDRRNLWFLVSAHGASGLSRPFPSPLPRRPVYPDIPPNLLIAGAVAV